MNERFDLLQDEKKLKILNGSLLAFAEHGYEKCSMADVAATVGISKALLFHYFESKDGLFEYLFTYTQNLRAQYISQSTIHPTDEVIDAFTKWVKEKMNFVRANHAAYRFLSRFSSQDEIGGSQILLNTDFHRIRKGFKEAEVVQLLDWVGHGLINEQLQAEIPLRKTLAGLDAWADQLRKMLYKDKYQ